MSKRDLHRIHSDNELHDAVMDASKMAEITLDEVLEEESPEEIIDYELSHTTVESERSAKRVLAKDTGRTMSRVLFVTRDTAYFEHESSEMKSMLSIAVLFDEVHILVLTKLGTKERAVRVADNLWVYSTSAQFWWRLPWSALEKAKEQLSFSDGFRPDLIVGLDPYESGLAAIKIGRAFNRPFQVHVSEDFTSSAFSNKHPANKWRKRMARYVLKRTRSVRTATSVLKASIEKMTKKNADVSVLPQFHNFSALMDAKAHMNIHDKYKEYVFIALAFGNLTAESSLHDTFSALNSILHNPRIGLVVVGTGPAKKLFEEKVELLGLKKNVVFVPHVEDKVSFLKTADVLIETRTTKESEETVLQAAAAGLPLVMYATDLRNDLFKDGESASICEKGDVHTLSRNVTAFLNHQSLRIQYKDAAQHIVRTRLSEDETTYYRAFRDSIELALVVEK